MANNYDLRDYEDNDKVADAFSALVSGGKLGYKTIIEKKKILPKCEKCGRGGDDGQKFCPHCGGKMVIPLTHCSGCKKKVDDSQKFCTNCGQDLKQQQ